jgi:glyoxylase-like metal-dependent hydrolase (beta-lactamase superfamily II)
MNTVFQAHAWVRATGLPALSLAVMAGAAGAQDAARFSAQPLPGGLTVISGPDGNVVVGETADGLTLIDGGRAENADALLAFIRARAGDAPVTTLINTDWHSDRIGLNDALGAAGANIVAHFNAQPWMEFGAEDLAEGVAHAPRAPEALPDTLAPDTGMTLTFGEDQMEIGFLVQAHCDSDLYIYFPGANVLVTGAAIRSDGWTMIDYWAGGYLGGLDDAYGHLLTVVDDETVIVPASGPLMTRADLQAQAEMYSGLFMSVAQLVLGAKSPQEAVDAEPTAGLRPEWAGADEFTRRAHESFRTHLRRDPRLGPIP